MNRRFALKSVIAAAGFAALAACDQMMTTDLGIIDVAAGDGRLNSFVAAATAADLADTLRGPGPFTVFIPTDEAFAALPAGRLDTLLRPENKDRLAVVLGYHIVRGAITADQLIDQRQSVATLNGTTVQIDGRDGLRIGNANIVTSDISASNGVIHVIDGVLLP
ncbi:fasciclin domain-containing protein [Yoonia sp.]|uniref:fasciclin domain-containing protein n=1 Tax=Yoonia sp. TaxID=2212373 RepID=UPI00391BDCAF